MLRLVPAGPPAQCAPKLFAGLQEILMNGPIEVLTRRARPLAVAAGLACALLANPASARGPENIADVAEKVIDAVVNISTSQTVTSLGDGSAIPNLPPGSPFEEFFEDFFKNRRQQGDRGGSPQPRKVN